MEKVRSKEDFRKDGIPVGVGIPEIQPTEEELHEVAVEKESLDRLDSIMEADMGQEGYVRQPAPTDVGELIQFINSLKPFKYQPVYDKDGNLISIDIKDGDLPPDILFDYWGFLAHTNSLSNYERRDYDITMADFEIAQISKMMSRPRSEFTPERLSWEDNTQHLVRAKNLQSVGGFERIMTVSQRVEEEKAYRVQKRPTRWENLQKKLKGGTG